MSVRRWIGAGGIVVAVASGSAATVRGFAAPEFEAEVAVRLPGPSISDPERLFAQPEVRDLVHLRLGGSPPVRVKPATRDTVLVQSRGATAQEAAEATKTYAASYVDVQRRRSDAALTATAVDLQRAIAQMESQVQTAVAPQQAAIAAQIGALAQRLEQIRAQYQSPNPGAAVVSLTPATPVDDGARRAWILAVLGGTVALGAVASARRSGPGSPDLPQGS